MSTLASQSFHEGCAICGTHYAIDIPDDVVDAARRKDLIVFAGAGISTERPDLFPETFYEEIVAQVPEGHRGEPFPTVMQEFESIFGRRELIARLIKRIEYVSTFRTLQNRTTAFHREIATISQLDAIFTTNWDDFFERFAGARPFVLDEDFAFFDLAERRVLKLHGSITSLSTIVATTSDYEHKEADWQESVMGAKLRDYLATKTLVFVGYSMTDPDFRSVYHSILERMGDMRGPAYVATPADFTNEFGLRHLRTDGGHFAHLLKNRLEISGDHIPDSNLDRAAALHRLVLEAHLKSEQMLADEKNLGAYTQSYQDGLLAALARMDLMRDKGVYSDPKEVMKVIHDYGHLFAQAIAERQYYDACYIEGYMIGTRSVLLSNEDLNRLPLIQTFGNAMYRAKKQDPHRDLDAPWWFDRPEWTLYDFAEKRREGSEAVESWLARGGQAARSRGRRSPGLLAEHKRISSSLESGQVPQHTEFLSS